MNAPLWPSYQQNRVIGNRIAMDQNSNTYNNVCQFGVVVQSGGDIIVSNNKFNGCNNGNAISFTGAPSGAQTLEPVVITGNSAEGAANGISFNWSNNQAYAAQVVITGNQLWANTPIRITSSGSSSGAAAVCGSVACVVTGLTVSGNHLNSALGSSTNSIVLDGVYLGAIGNNTNTCTGGCSASTAISLDANTSYVTVGVNGYDPGYTHIANSGSNNRINATD